MSFCCSAFLVPLLVPLSLLSFLLHSDIDFSPSILLHRRIRIETPGLSTPFLSAVFLSVFLAPVPPFSCFPSSYVSGSSICLCLFSVSLCSPLVLFLLFVADLFSSNELWFSFLLSVLFLFISLFCLSKGEIRYTGNPSRMIERGLRIGVSPGGARDGSRVAQVIGGYDGSHAGARSWRPRAGRATAAGASTRRRRGGGGEKDRSDGGVDGLLGRESCGRVKEEGGGQRDEHRAQTHGHPRGTPHTRATGGRAGGDTWAGSNNGHGSGAGTGITGLTRSGVWTGVGVARVPARRVGEDSQVATREWGEGSEFLNEGCQRDLGGFCVLLSLSSWNLCSLLSGLALSVPRRCALEDSSQVTSLLEAETEILEVLCVGRVGEGMTLIASLGAFYSSSPVSIPLFLPCLVVLSLPSLLPFFFPPVSLSVPGPASLSCTSMSRR
ncbi:hypothetical protein Tco_0578659 [Tanacetum coccineum]